MISIVSLFIGGLLLSAFFSGSETGFYRVTRVRLVIDGISGSWIARRLLWLTNNPSLFVATTLIGNNVANYLVSLAIVLAVRHLQIESQAMEVITPIVLAPIVFVYGELLPKNLFYFAPNLLLQRTGWFFLACALAFSPIAALLWLFGRLLESVLGETPLRLQLTLARQELQQILEEGGHAGILRPAQQRLAQSLFNASEAKIGKIAIPLARATAVPCGAKKADMLRLARRQRKTLLPVTDPSTREIVGYVRTIDQYLSPSDTIEHVLPLITLPPQEANISAMLKMQSQQAEMAYVVDNDDRQAGIVYLDQLTKVLLDSDNPL